MGLPCAVAWGDALETAPPPVPAPGDVEDPVLSRPDVARGSAATASTKATSGIRLSISKSTRPEGGSLRDSGEYIGVARISAALLARPVELQVNPGDPIFAFGLPAQMARLDLDLEGKQYQLYFAEAATEESGRLRHVTMSVLNHADAYARFSIDQSSGEVYGTLRTADAVYVFETNDVKGEQAVYRYDANKHSNALSDWNNSLIGKSRLARRHHQIEAIAALQPDFARSSVDSVFIRGGELGSVVEVSPEAFKHAAVRLAALTQVSGREQFRFEKQIAANGGGRILSFKQLIDGIPIQAVNQVAVDQHGKILEMAASVVPVDIARLKPLLSAQDAASRTAVEWAAMYGQKIGAIQPTSPVAVRYERDPSGDSLNPFYVFEFEVSGDGWYLSRVDAVSGKVAVRSLTVQG